MRNAVIVVLAILAGACVKLGHIQQTEPVRTTKFTGPHKYVAQCIHARLGGKVQDDSFGAKYVLYNAMKSRSADGLTHYAITVRQTGQDEGVAEWRVMAPSGQRYATPQLSDVIVQELWAPVEDCVARAKGSS